MMRLRRASPRRSRQWFGYTPEHDPAPEVDPGEI